MDLKVYALLNEKIKELAGGGLTQADVEKIVTDEVAKIVAGAPEDFDTLKEMSDWISSHEESAASMNSAIQTNANDISALDTNKVDKVAGKSLISDTEIVRLAKVTNYNDSGVKADIQTNADNIDINKTNISTLAKHMTGDLTDSDFSEDSTVAMTKTVPTGMSDYAGISKIGGKTVKTKNLIPFPYYQNSSQNSGITNVVNKDQSVTLSGTATDSTVVYRLVFPLFNEIKLDNKKYIFDQSFEPRVALRIDNRIYKKDGSYLSITATDNRYIEIDNTSGVYDYISHFSVYATANTIVNITIKPMLYVYEDEYIPYEPYFEGLHNAPVESVVSTSADGTTETTLLIPDSIKNLPDYGVEGNVVDFENGTYTHTNTITNGAVTALSTAETINISDMLMPIRVEAGGTITFQNEYNLDMPNTVVYKKEVSLS